MMHCAAECYKSDLYSVEYPGGNPCSPTATAERRKRWTARMKERIAQAEQRGLLHEAKSLRADLRRG